MFPDAAVAVTERAATADVLLDAAASDITTTGHVSSRPWVGKQKCDDVHRHGSPSSSMRFARI